MTVYMKQTEAILNCVQNHKRPPAAKAILKKSEKSGHITLSDFKIIYKATVTKTAWHCCLSDQMRRPIEQSRGCTYNKLTSDESAKR